MTHTDPTILALASTLAAHDAACAVADRSVAHLTTKIDALVVGNPEGARLHAMGRYWWPTMDRLRAERADAWIEAALRAGADPSKLGPRADVAHIQRRIAVYVSS